MAEALGKTVGELAEQITYDELIEWAAYFQIKAEEEKRAQERARAEARARQSRIPRRR